MSEQDFPQHPEEGDAEEALTLDPNLIFDRDEEKDVDQSEETAATEAPPAQTQTTPLAQVEAVPLASRIPLVKIEEPSPTESEDSPIQAPSATRAGGLPYTESSAPLAQTPSATHAESLPLTESSAPLAQASSPVQMEETPDEPEAPEARNSSIATGEQTMASGGSTARPKPCAVSADAAGVPAAPTGTTLSSTASKSPLSDIPVSSPLSSTPNAPPLSPTSTSSRIASLPAASPVFETPSSSSILETQSVGDEGVASSSSPSASAPPDELAESMWTTVRDRSHQSDSESAPALVQPVLAREQPLTGEGVRLPDEITPENDIVGESAPMITGQIETVTLGLHTTAIPVMTEEIPVMTRIDPTPIPRDVLAHRVEDGDGETESFEEFEDVEEDASLFEPLDETSV